ncbi:MAG: hypothetical protein Ta2B_27110 [Termitinemataceae bacterium]|nr:MAG: hypothetical protein Ta2B_27110 [Termitinemataceae bacterium]
MRVAKKKPIIVICFAFLSALVSIFLITSAAQNKFLTNYLNNKLDKQVLTASGFFASATAASIAISALPGDTGTALSNQLANVGGFFLAVMGAIAFEKILLLISPFISFSIIIPVSALFYILYILLKKEWLKKLCIKSIFYAFIVFLIVPFSLFLSFVVETKLLSRQIELSQQTIQKEVALIDSAQEEIIKDERAWYEKVGEKIKQTASSLGVWVADKTQSVLKSAQRTLTNLINALISMLVTTIILPLCTVFIFAGITKKIFALNIPSRQ